MKRPLIFIFLLSIALGLASKGSAYTLITKTDIETKLVLKADLIKTADNAIILFDASSSMAKPFRGTTRYEAARNVLMDRNRVLPDLGHTFGLYLYTPWKAVYPMQAYDRDAFADALASLPRKAAGPTMLAEGLSRLDRILKNLSGRTAVFLFTDGVYTRGSVGKRPSTIARELSDKYEVCFYLVSTGDDFYSTRLFQAAEKFDFCSQVISLGDFIDHPMYHSEALFTVKTAKSLVIRERKKLVGVKTENFLFDFDNTDLTPDVRLRLDLLGKTMADNPSLYAVLSGFTDNRGTELYNLGLSFRRVTRIGNYLTDTHGIERDRLLKFWYGELNPVGDNTTEAGRAENRRVEILVGGM